jgi:hypothetical protein
METRHGGGTVKREDFDSKKHCSNCKRPLDEHPLIPGTMARAIGWSCPFGYFNFDYEKKGKYDSLRTDR